MVNGLFKEISEEEMMSVNGGCGGGGSPYAGPMPCQECKDKGNEYIEKIVKETANGFVEAGPIGAVKGFVKAIITTPVPEPHSEHAH